jgi:hypothetical protein
MLSKTDLWIVPPMQHSAWFAHLDWYLNWQMCKGLAHKSLALDAQMYRLAEEYDIPVESPHSADKAPLLIACKNLSPADYCLVLPFKGDLKDWLVEAKTIAFKIKAADVHIFLPIGADVDKAEKAWSKMSGECEVHFTADLGVEE